MLDMAAQTRRADARQRATNVQNVKRNGAAGGEWMYGTRPHNNVTPDCMVLVPFNMFSAGTTLAEGVVLSSSTMLCVTSF